MKKKRVVFCMVVAALLFACLILRMVDLQIYGGELMQRRAEAIGTTNYAVKAVRGEITDRNSKVLVTNENTFVLKAEDVDDEVLSRLSKILDKAIAKDDLKTGHSFSFTQNITKEQAAAIGELNLKGVSIEEGYRRKSVGVKLSHTAGTVGSLTAEEYQALAYDGYGAADVVGKSGVEKFAEKYLKGENGEMTVTSDGQQRGIEAKDGCRVGLCIDKELQKKCEDELRTAVEQVSRDKGTCGGGAVVALDPSNGDVLAMCSYPDYDIGEYSENYTELLQNPANPLLNRCISGCFEPGSVYKPLVALAALSEGAMTENEKIRDEGVYKYYAPSYMPACYLWTNKRKTHGLVNVSEALGESCNYYFYEVGRRLGIKKIAEYSEKFGLSDVCGIEIEGEARGTVASPKTKEQWFDGDTLQAAIGQSVNMFTPLSMARYTAAVANEGHVYKPHVVKKISEYSGKILYERNVEEVNFANIDKKYYKAVKQGMKLCCESGTASEAFEDKKFTAAGKTGTAQVPKGPENGLFVGFAPYDSPKIAVCVVIEHGNGTYTARAASEIMSKWIEICGN